MRNLLGQNWRQRLVATVGIMATMATAIEMPPVQAAQTVVLRYGIFRGSIPVSDLSTFAETGETSRKLRRYLNLADQEPEQFRTYLTEAVETDPETLNLLLKSPAGDALLSEMSEYLYVPNRGDDQDLLRSALEASTENDSKLSMIELLQDYPAEKVHINVGKAISTYRQFASIQERFGGILNGRLGTLLERIGL